MPEISNPKDLFLHELGDILYVERKLAEKVLPKLIDEVTDDEFKSGLENHLKETRQHVTNVEQVFKIFGEEPHAEECVGFEGLKKEHDELLEKSSERAHRSHRPWCSCPHRELRDRGIRGPPSNGEGVRRGRSVTLLDTNLKQEKEALREVEKIATRLSNESVTASATR